MTPTNLQEWIARPELLNRETLYELRNLLARFPYFQAVRLLYLKNLFLIHDTSFGAELRKAALYVADRRMLFYLIEGDRFSIRPKKGETALSMDSEPGLDRTLNLIDAFLASIPEESVNSPVFDISTDYSFYLFDDCENEKNEMGGGTPKMNGQELIDGFIEKARNEVSLRIDPLENRADPEAFPDETETELTEDESCFTETLAKIYIKQKRYSKALEIIKKLSLKYPKKNAYFADQIRFLEKLIINTKSK